MNQDAAPFTVSLTGSDDYSVFSWGATAGTGISSVSVTGGQGTANVTYTVTLQSGFSGPATFTASLSDTVNPTVTKAVNIQVDAVAVNNPPTITEPANPITTVEQNAPAFNVTLVGNDDGGVYNWSATPGTGVSSISVTTGQTAANVTFNITLQGGFSGTATFTASLSDNVNPAVLQAVNITVTPPPPPPNHLVISQVYGGGGNTGATYQNDYVEIYNPTGSSVDVAGWTLQYYSATSTGVSGNIQPLGGIIGPGEYFLVSLASGGAVGAPLPTANISGSINMSGTAGKIALASNGDPLIGPSGCPVAADPDLVDFVGYGTTANCREGSTNAPAPSSTTALFRKNGGLTDTDVNGADFVTGLPSPRRTTPIQEIGPFVVTIDPVSGATTAPRDASITITFSEPVDVNGTWYGISCTRSGAHTDATFAVTDGGATQVITPNSNFVAGEQCTVIVFKDNVHDKDLDDSGPNTDTLPANKVWSFTVATGAAPPYTPDVHLTMGYPSNAIADTAFPNDYLMMKPAYALSYNRDKGTPNWVSWHLTNEWYGSLSRVDTFRPDPQVPPDWYRVQAFDFFATGFDRGHMTPNADRDNENRIPVNQETYLMSNMVPQAPDNNQGPWANLENYLRTLTDAGNELYIVSGPAGQGGTGSNGGVTTTLAAGHITVPASTWKVVLVLPKADGDDVSRVTAATRTIAVIMPNTQGIRTNNPNDWQGYLTTVDAVEQLTGYNFFSKVPADIQNSIEAGINGTNPPGTADGGTTTAEDTQKTFTLDAVSPNGTPLTSKIISNPLHGSLACTGINCTYNPAPDYNGTDTFTFLVNDGLRDSNTSTLSITVTEVNDPVTAVDDTKSTDEDTALTFSASDLALNDSAGPANESGQTLMVNSVTPQNTHGTVVLQNGVITYMPDLNYNGPASFTYEVCDDGTTNGTSSAKCANATVNIMVAPVNDVPVANSQSVTTDEDTPKAITLTGSDVEDNTLSFSVITPPAHGTLNGTGANRSYTPAADYNGTDSFTFKANDGTADSGPATVSITINAVNDNPSPSNDSATTDEDTTVMIDVLHNDTDVDGDTLTLQSVSGETNGTVSIVDNKAVFSPNANYHGTGSFTYTVSDSHGGTATANVTVGINSVNDNPVANADSASTDEDTAVTIDARANDSDVDGDSLTITGAGGASKGTTVLITSGPNVGKLLYTPNLNENGSDSFTYTLSDGHGGSATGTVNVSINPVNDAPVLSNVPASTTIPELVAYAFTATASDVDVPTQTLTFSLVGAPTGASIDPLTGQFAWTPTEAQGGIGTPYQFKVRVTDGVAVTEAVVAINVNEVNQAPTLNQIGNKTVTLGRTLSFTAIGIDQDLPAQTLSYSLTGAVPAGATINSSTGEFTWTPTAQQVGAIYTFKVRVSDGSLYAEEQISVGVAYSWSGLLSPINGAGSSIFKLGSTVPVKFTLMGASAGINNAVARLMLIKISDGIAGTEFAAESTSAATTGNLFRYDTTSGQYIFNLDTSGLAPGTYELSVNMGDGLLRLTTISLSN